MRLSWASVMPILNEALHFYSQDGAQIHSGPLLWLCVNGTSPGGILADRIGYRRTILFSLIGMAAVTALMSTVLSETITWLGACASY
ncbi:MAG: hypothetical protein ACLRUM_08525 [Veillonella parvula]